MCGFTGTQTDRPAVQSCADPSLSGNKLESGRLLSEDNAHAAASGRSRGRERQDTGSCAQPSLRRFGNSSPPPVRTPLPCGVGQAARTAHLATRVLLSLPAEEPAATREPCELVNRDARLAGVTCMDAPWPRLCAGFSF